MTPASLPLTALRAFEAAARHLSFKLAAAELHVTPTAVSHQIQQLEQILGVELFVRIHRGLTLTPAANACLPYVRNGFDALCAAVDIVRAHQDDGDLTVSAPPSFTMRLLMPVMQEFLALHPEIDLNITTRMREPRKGLNKSVDNQSSYLEWTETSDIVIVFGEPATGDIESTELLPLSLSLLCSPSLAQQLHTPDDVRKFPWIHDDRGARHGDLSFWTQWLAAAGLDMVDHGRGKHFTHASLAIDSAVRSMGLLVTTKALCASELSTGALVSPFDIEVRMTCAYQMLNRASTRPAVQHFKDWLGLALRPDPRPDERG